MPKIPNNRDMFAERGDPWEDDSSHPHSHARTPRLSPDGLLRLNRRAHRLAITEGLTSSKSPSPRAPLSRDDDPDMDRHFADKARPISLRLAKERNQIIPRVPPIPQGERINGMTTTIFGGKSDAPGSLERAMINARAKSTARRTSRLVKVK